jgi:hypothetical protein
VPGRLIGIIATVAIVTGCAVAPVSKPGPVYKPGEPPFVEIVVGWEDNSGGGPNRDHFMIIFYPDGKIYVPDAELQDSVESVIEGGQIKAIILSTDLLGKWE